MHPERARWLTSPAGIEALASVDANISTASPTALAAALRRRFAPAEASALAEQLTIRVRARERFGPAAEQLLFTTEGLEMATHPLVAERRASRLRALGAPVADLTCGIGGDLLACIDAGLTAVGVELDEATVLLARHNACARGAAHLVRGDACRAPLRLGGMAVLLDPARRSSAGRRFDPAAFVPDWESCLGLLRAGRTGVMKAPPGIEHRHLPEEAEVEFVQLGRSMREAALWVGEGAQPGLKRALLLPSGEELDSTAAEIDSSPVSLQRYVFDPEYCVTRAGLVRQLALLMGGSLLDAQIAYFTSDEPAFHPMAATFEVLEVVPFALARLRERLRAGRWRAEEIRRRGFPVEPDALRRLLGKMDGDPVAVLLTTLRGERKAIISRKMAAAGPAHD
ncbi:MAG: SAM-dependent methyltransferase [Tepidiformaceae bacterium]